MECGDKASDNLLSNGNDSTTNSILDSKYVKYFYTEEFEIGDEIKSPKPALFAQISDNVTILYGVESWNGIVYDIDNINDFKVKARNLNRRIPGYFYISEGKTVFQFNRFPRRIDHIIAPIEEYVTTLSLLSTSSTTTGFGKKVNEGRIVAHIGREEGYVEGKRKQLLQMNLSPQELDFEITRTLNLPSGTDITNLCLSKLHTIEEAQQELIDFTIQEINFYVLNPEYNFNPYEEPGIMIECDLTDDNIEKILSLALKWKQDRVSVISHKGTVNFQLLL